MSTKKLLSITNLKKYFPIAKSSIFQKEQLYVRANEDITIDIYEGETIGVVGESGCGKSTLGRVLLQLYPQTAGNTIYYGSTLEDLTPAYVEETLTKLPKHRKLYDKAVAKCTELEQKVETVGEDQADFFLLQDRNLARCEVKSQFDNMVKLLGGFFVADENGKGVSLLLEQYHLCKKRNGVRAKRAKLLQAMTGMADGSSKKTSAEASVADLDKQIADWDAKIVDVTAKLDALRAQFSGNAEFVEHEALRDNGIDLSRLQYAEMRKLRKDLQIIFQDPYSSLNPRFTIGQIIEEGLRTHNLHHEDKEATRQYIVDTMQKCGLQEYMVHRYPHQFSGGQRQRISIARALAVQPKFVVCDECVSALDVSIQSQIINLLMELKERENLTYMFISHDLSVVRYISDRICVMYLGNVVELADAATIFDDPRHPYTVALLSSIPTTDQDALHKERILLEGNIPSPIKPPSGCKFHTRCYMACDKCKRVPPELREIEPGHFLACHFPEKKLDEKGNYLFELPKMERKSNR